jgi:hypothetical protein
MSRPLHFLLIGTALALTGCTSFKETLGLTRHTPDEFVVVGQAPLAIPSEYVLRPPTPGASRPQELPVPVQAEAALIGQLPRAASAPSSAEAALLRQAASDSADPAIRQKIDAEAAEAAARNMPTWKRLIKSAGGVAKPTSTVVDAPAETERLQSHKQSGQPVTGEKTPVFLNN